MKKHLLAIAAILLILSLTACTQYVFDWDSLRPQEITDIEDLVLFMQSRETASARLNLTVDPDDSYFPITIKGTKKISGRIEIAESRGPVYFSSTATLPGSVSARANSLKNLFIVGSGAILESDSLTINVDDSADGLFNSVIEVSGGTIRGEKLNIQISDNSTVIGLYIGKGTEAENIAIENSNPGKIDIDKNNEDSSIIFENISNNNPDIPQTDISGGFDVTTEQELEVALSKYGMAKLLNDFELTKSISISDNAEAYLNLNGKTLTFKSNENDSAAIIIDNASVVIDGNGTINADVPKYGATIKLQNNGKAEINSGTFTATKGGAIDVGTQTSQSVATAIINGGTFEGQEFCVGIWSNSNLTINDGSFTARDNAVIGTNGDDPGKPSITINGGSFNGGDCN